MSSVPRVAVGLVAVETPCPNCGVLETIAVNLAGVLTVVDDDTMPTLKVRAKSKPLDHSCGRIDATLFSEDAADVRE